MIRENLDLTNFTSVDGFKMSGTFAGGRVGYSVSSAGDINGDEVNDIVVGAPYISTSPRSQAGAAYVIYGKIGEGVDVALNNNLGASPSYEQGFKILGAASGDQAGWSVSSAGDVNGDGLNDIIIGAHVADFSGRVDTGVAYVIYGKKGGSTDITLYNTNLPVTAQGFRILGAYELDHTGIAVSGTGDINGDGFDDVIVGAAWADPDGRSQAGISYVIYGKLGVLPSIDLLSFTNEQGFKILGAVSDDRSGSSVSSAGDVDGDGVNDIIIGAPADATTRAGTAYVIYGTVGNLADIDLLSLTPSQGFKILGSASGDQAGISVSGAGDINGDTISDILIGAAGADPHDRTDAGIAYVIYGKRGGLVDISLSSLTPEQGFRILGAASGDNTGSVSSAGDINADGITDIIIGARFADPNGKTSAGISYIVYGKAGGLTDIDLLNFTTLQGFKVLGDIAGDQAGISASGVGDINKDGIGDIIVGASLANPNARADAGTAYAIYGTNCTSSIVAATLSSLMPYDMALLSLKVYDSPKDKNISLPDGWLPKISSDDAGMSKDGYFARLYIKNDTAVIAQRGTEPEGAVPIAIDLFNDALLFFDQVTLQFSHAKAFFKYAQSYMCTNSTYVKYLAFTGHSLGASLAELLGAKFKFPAITFESPGVREVLTNNAGNFPPDAISYSDTNVIIYNAAPNLINTMAKHVGLIRRVYPSVDSMLIPGGYPYAVYYSWTYSAFGQHKIGPIVNQFNNITGQPKVVGQQTPWPEGAVTGIYKGFDHYMADDTNPYYWNAVYAINGASVYLTNWLVNFLLATAGQAMAVHTGNTGLPTTGVNITGDNTNNIIWGTTNFADTITAGTSDDIHYMHEGDDISTDKGGYDTYIVPIGFKGNKVINDAGGLGVIKLEAFNMTGEAYPVISSLCPIVPSGTSYFMNMEKAGGYYFIPQGDDLLITPDCADTIQSLSNSLTIKHFNWEDWGDFGLTKYTGNDKVALVGSNSKDYLDCSLHKRLFSKCLASALEGEDILVAEIGQTAVLTGSDVGKKFFKLLKANGSRRSSGHEQLLSEATELQILGIKEGDILDLSDVLTDPNSATISQNGTHLQIDLGNNNLITTQITLGSSFVWFDLYNGNISVSNQNMTRVLEDAGIIIVNGTIVTNNTTDSSSSPTSTTPIPTTSAPITSAPTMFASTMMPTLTTSVPTTSRPTEVAPTSSSPTTPSLTTSIPTSFLQATSIPTILAPTTSAPTTAITITPEPTTSSLTTGPTIGSPTPMPTTSNPTNSPTLMPTILFPTEAPTEPKNNTAIIAGAVGGVAFLGIVATVSFLYYKKLYCFKQFASTGNDAKVNGLEMPSSNNNNQVLHAPIGIALSNNKINLVPLTASNISFDYNDNGVKAKTSWIGPEDAFLVYDHNNNHEVDSSKELVLTRWSKTSQTDFTALKEVFDSNKDNKFDANDTEFNKFIIWQDKNQDGISQAEEMTLLSKAGLLQINFDTEQTIKGEFFNKQQEMQVAGVSWANGHQTFAYDLMLEANNTL